MSIDIDDPGGGSGVIMQQPYWEHELAEVQYTKIAKGPLGRSRRYSFKDICGIFLKWDMMEKGLIDKELTEGHKHEWNLETRSTTRTSVHPWRRITRMIKGIRGVVYSLSMDNRVAPPATASGYSVYRHDGYNESIEGNENIEGNMSYVSEISMASSEASLPDKRHKELPELEYEPSTGSLLVLGKKKFSEGSPDDSSYRSLVVLLEKVVWEWGRAPRILGLYPHSADPPIQNTEKIVPEPPPSHHTKINQAFYHRPGRSHTIASHRYNHRSLSGVRLTISNLAERLLSSILQATKVFGPFLFTVLLRVTLLGRIYKKVVHTYLNKHLKAQSSKSTKIHSRKMECTDIDPSGLEWLGKEGIDLTLYDLDELLTSGASSPLEEAQPESIPSTTSSNFADIFQLEPTCITGFTDFTFEPPPPTYTAENHEYPPPDNYAQFGTIPIVHEHYAPSRFTDNLIYPQQIPSSYASHLAPEPVWHDFVNLSGPSTPTSFSGTPDMDMPEMPFMDSSTPGLSLPTSLNVTPASEGLETPTFTPGHTPVVCSPQQLTSVRKYICEHESCGHKQFDRPCDLNKHLKTHNKHLECDYLASSGCQMKFSTEKDRRRHRETVHEKRRPFVCHICVKQGAEGKEGRFSRKDNLRIHKKKVHGIE